jgi:hypothetical protein
VPAVEVNEAQAPELTSALYWLLSKELKGAVTVYVEAVAPVMLENEVPPLVLNCHRYVKPADPVEVGETVNTAFEPEQTVWLATVAAVTLFTLSVPALDVNAEQEPEETRLLY